MHTLPPVSPPSIEMEFLAFEKALHLARFTLKLTLKVGALNKGGTLKVTLCTKLYVWRT